MTQPIIRFENVTKKYDEHTTVLNGVSFEIRHPATRVKRVED